MQVLFAEPSVAKKKAQPKAGVSRKPMIVQLRGSEEWKTWVEAIAHKEGDTMAKFIERAVRQFAKAGGYPEPPMR